MLKTKRVASTDWPSPGPDTFARFRSGRNEHPRPYKQVKDDSFIRPGEDVEFRRLDKNHGAIKLPKIGEVRFRGYRPMGGRLRSVTLRKQAG